MNAHSRSSPDATPFAPPARPRATAWLPPAASIIMTLAVICVLCELLAGPAYRFDLIALGPALQTMRWAATGAAVVFAVALAAAWFASRRQSPRAALLFVLSAAVGLLAAAPPAMLWYRVQHLPHIHDISTDSADPPKFVAVLPLRQGARNSTRYDAAVAPLQAQAYPDVRTAVLAAPPDQVFEKALQVARDMGWEIVDADRPALHIEATDTSLLFGFKDDVVIRIKASAGASRVDLRSLSRVGGSDFGVNAKRIRRFIARLEAS